MTLPASRWVGLIVEQQLDDARALLLDDAHRDEDADPDQLSVEQQHGEEREAAAVLAVGHRLDGRQRERRRGERAGGLRVVESRVAQRRGDAHALVGGLQDGAVRADETERAPGCDGEAQVVEGDQFAVATSQAVELEHPRRALPAWRRPERLSTRRCNYQNSGALYRCRPSGGAAGTLSRPRPARPCLAAARGRAGRRR